MTPLMIQGLFHVMYTSAFCALAWGLWVQSKKTGNQIGRTLAISFLLGVFEYTCLTLAVLVFSKNPEAVKVLVGFGATFLSVTAITITIKVYSYVFPKFPFKPIAAVMGLLTAFMLVYNARNYTPKGISDIGLLDVSGPQWQIMTIGLLMMLIFVPMSIGFIYKSFKKKLYVKGTLVGLGFLINILFMPLTYQVTTIGAYVFFGTLAALGFALLVSGIVLHPFSKTVKR